MLEMLPPEMLPPSLQKKKKKKKRKSVSTWGTMGRGKTRERGLSPSLSPSHDLPYVPGLMWRWRIAEPKGKMSVTVNLFPIPKSIGA